MRVTDGRVNLIGLSQIIFIIIANAALIFSLPVYAAATEFSAAVSDFSVYGSAGGLTAVIGAETDTVLSVTISNDADEAKTAFLYCAYYQDETTIYDIKAIPVLLEKNESKTVSFEKREFKMKLFFWDKNLSPLCVQEFAGINTVYPMPSNEVLKNPYRGYVYYGTDSEGNSTIGTSTDADKFSAIVCRPLWSEIEISDGEYDWSKVDSAIATAKKYDIQVCVGFQAAYNNKASMNSPAYMAKNVIKQAAPLWLFDEEHGCAYTETYYDSSYVVDKETGKTEGRVTAKVPVWDDSVYLEEMGQFIQAFLERYNDNPYIASVDMRTYGNWGEWHVSGLDESAAIGFEAMKKHIDLWQDAKLPVIMLGGESQAVKYARDTLNCGVRLDGLVSLDDSNTHQRMYGYKNQALLIGEWIEPVYKNTAGAVREKWTGYWEDYIPVLFERSMQETGLSITSMANHSSKEFYRDFPDIVNYWANKMGYRFRAVKMEYPTCLTGGRFKLMLKNDGIVRMMNGTKEAGVKLALFDKDNRVIDVFELKDDDLTQLDAGNFMEIDEEYSFKNSEKAAKLGVGFFTDVSLQAPDIKLANQANMIDNWYVVNEMPVLPPDDLTELAVVSASGEQIEAGYGYHHTDYAFDDDSDTYWSAKVNADVYVQAEFAESVEACKISYTVPYYIDTAYRLLAKTDSGWIVLQSGIGLQSGTHIFGSDTELELSAVKLEFDKAYSGVETKESELLRNPSFEEDIYTTLGWSGYAGGTLKFETENTYDGIGCARVENRRTNGTDSKGYPLGYYRGIKQNVKEALENSGAGCYRVSIMVKPDEITDLNVPDDENMGYKQSVKYSLRLLITYSDDKASATFSTTAECSGDEWSVLEVPVAEVDTENILDAYIYVESGDRNTTDFCVDSASMTKIE